jgi:hypothetical protein
MAVLQLKRGTAARWVELNPILAAGEPGFEYDTKKLKIGDGNTAWNDLPYIGSECEYTGKDEEVVCVDTYMSLPDVGNADCIYKVGDEKALYQWNATEQRYEPLSNGEGFDPSKINLINGGNANG